MNLGWCDICLKVSCAEVSREFYEKLGFRRVEGADEEGWAVVTTDQIRLGLYEAKYMEGDQVALNFRGGDVFAIADQLQTQGIAFAKGPSRAASGGCSATVFDPDGYRLFFDTASGEMMKE